MGESVEIKLDPEQRTEANRILAKVVDEPEWAAATIVELQSERDALLEKCRRALRAEQAYQDAIHARVGSRYGAQRRDREVAAARSMRDQTAKELGL